MTNKVKAAGLLLAIAACGAIPDQASAASATRGTEAWAAVDPFIGTGGEGHTFPGAVVPFGMIQLSPDTQIKPRKEAYGWAAGYRHDDSTIVGFSHTHFSGTGHSDLGDVLVMPTAGEVKLERGDIDKPGSGYTSRFTHDDEIAQPGYYAVTLKDDDIRAELTASRARRRASLHLRQGQARARARRSAHEHVRLSGQGVVVAPAPARRWHAHRIPRNARLGTGSPVVLRDALLAAGQRTSIPRHGKGRALQGLPAAGQGRSAPACADRRTPVGRCARLRRCAREAVGGEGRDLPGRRRQRHRQPRRRGGRFRFRSRARRCEGAMGAGARCDRCRCARADADQLLHRAVPRLHGPEPVHGQRRPLSRARQRRAPGEGLHELLDVLALGHLSRVASAAHAGATGAAQQRLHPVAARCARRRAPTACCRSGRSTARRRGA